jgi:hypothetical protein
LLTSQINPPTKCITIGHLLFQRRLLSLFEKEGESFAAALAKAN